MFPICLPQGKKYNIVSINTKLPECWGLFWEENCQKQTRFRPVSGRLTFVNVNVANDVTIKTLFDRIHVNTFHFVVGGAE